MAFTPEDGTGLEAANAYITTAFAIDYHNDRGNAAWAALTTPEQEQAIVRATDYIDKRFGRRFRGLRRTKSQGLEWPRINAFDNDEFLLTGGLDNVPRQLQKACAEYAIRASVSANQPLAPDNSTVGVNSKFEKVGPIEEKTEWQPFTKATGSTLLNANSILDYPEADLWIEELLNNSNSRQLVRA